jgi:hypothetical protein
MVDGCSPAEDQVKIRFDASHSTCLISPAAALLGAHVTVGCREGIFMWGVARGFLFCVRQTHLL